MGLEIYFEGLGNPWQTPTEVTRKIMSNLKGSPLDQDLMVLERLRAYAHQDSDPPPLTGKNARNPYLVKEREEIIAMLDERFDGYVEYVRKNHRGRRISGIS